MQAFAKISVLPTLFWRVCVAVRPALGLGRWGRAPQRHVERPVVAQCDASLSSFRVTDRRRRWTHEAHFADAESALRYAGANGGVVWERYVGPTGAANWWSLSDDECDARLEDPVSGRYSGMPRG